MAERDISMNELETWMEANGFTARGHGGLGIQDRLHGYTIAFWAAGVDWRKQRRRTIRAYLLQNRDRHEKTIAETREKKIRAMREFGATVGSPADLLIEQQRGYWAEYDRKKRINIGLPADY